MRGLNRRSSIAPPSFHLMPESSTAIVTSGRPVVVIHAVFTPADASTTCAPRTPFSSLAFAVFGLPASGVAANFQSLPSRSFGTVPAGARYALKSSGSPPAGRYGKLALALVARAHSNAVAQISAATSLFVSIDPTRAAVLHDGSAACAGCQALRFGGAGEVHLRRR